MITRSLNPQALAIEDAETEIKRVIFAGYLAGKSKAAMQGAVEKIVQAAEKQLTSSVLRTQARQSLYRLADRLWQKLALTLGVNGAIVAATLAYALGQRKMPPVQLAPLPATARLSAKAQLLAYETREKGVPLNMYSKNYTEIVRGVYNDLANENALDPEDETGRNSMRNKAEMQVRYEYHQQEIESLRDGGARLVVCSVHADCSDRCFPYQGRVYSLDGTSGQTDDGREFVPLEEATENPRDRYTTKAGKVYQNGLFGFNCRHRIYPYKNGMTIPYVSKATQRRENAVNTRQREYERDIRYHKQQAVLAQTAGDTDAYNKERRIAQTLNKKYIAFSKKNERAYYPDRTAIFD